MELDVVAKVVLFVSLLCGLFVTLQEPPVAQPEMPSVLLRDAKVGDGPEALIGARVRVHMQVWRSDGKLLADTFKRGLPFSFVIGEEGGDEFLHCSVLGMRVGGEREVEGDGRRLRLKLVSCASLSK
jgi:hypothetical protein